MSVQNSLLSCVDIIPIRCIDCNVAWKVAVGVFATSDPEYPRWSGAWSKSIYHGNQIHDSSDNSKR